LVNKENFCNKRCSAGILIAAHSCGIIVNFKEMVTDEGSTQIADLQGNSLNLSFMTMVAICKSTFKIQNMNILNG
jgi:hypothetical protein